MTKRILLIALVTVVSVSARVPEALVKRRIMLASTITGMARCGCTAHKPSHKPHHKQLIIVHDDVVSRCGCSAHKPHAKPKKELTATQQERCGCTAHKPKPKKTPRN